MTASGPDFNPSPVPIQKKAGGRAAKQYALALGIVAGTGLLNVFLARTTGPRVPGLVFLLAVVLLALFVGRGPVFFAGALSALLWNYFFLPPRFRLVIDSSEDALLFLLYFVVTMVLGQLVARIRAQEQAARQRDVLAESERLSKALLNSISHELRTPLAAITSASSNLIELQDAPLELRRRMVGEIQEATGRLNRLVGNLLDVTRLESGHVQARLEWCEVQDLVQTTLRSVERELSRHPVEIDIAKTLPLARLDFALMTQALANLLLNVAVHTPPGTAIRLHARQEDKYLTLSVADNGPGLPPDLLPRVFDKFTRAPNAAAGGSGLGLAIVKGFTEAQGGKIAAANRPTGGTVFTIQVPQSESPPTVETSI